ncbi:MAG: HlyD family efflux transporter periplasmic adaptor subunit [Angelakisella sp.]
MNSLSGKFTAIMLALFFIIYAGYQTFRFFYTGYKTESAYSFEVARVYSTSGVLIRDEHPIPQTYSDSLIHTLPEGGKFISTTPAAITYSNPAAAELALKSIDLKTEQQLLENIRRDANSSHKDNIGALSNAIFSSLRSLTGDATVGKVSDIKHIRLSLLDSISRMQVAVGNEVLLDTRITELHKTTDMVETGTVTTIGETGYFSRYVDGYEQQLTPELLETIDIAMLDQILQKEYPYNRESFGKCISDYNWYYVTSVPIEEAALFQPGVNMSLTFAGSDDKTVGGWVKSISEDKTLGRALLVIQSDDISPDTVARRTATVKLGFDDYKGIRFSKKALRIQDGVKGVFVRGKSAIKFKKVEIVYTGKDFYLSKLDYNSDVYLNIFDEIIVEGTDIYDGKPLE